MKNTRSYKSLNLIDHLYNQSLRSNSWILNRSKYLQKRFDFYSNFYCQDVRGHSGCVNALDFSSDGLLLASGGDDKRILISNISEILFNQTNQTSTVLSATHLSNIFTIKFDNHNRRIISAGNDEQILVHDIEKQHLNSNRNHSDELVDVFLETSPINCLSIQPNENEIFLAATEDGHIHLYDLRSTSTEHDQPTIIVAESFDGSYHSCTFNPQQTNFVATANARQGIELYDIRLCKSPVLRYGVSKSITNKISTDQIDDSIEGMSVNFNKNGSLLYALRRRLPPVIFKLNQSRAFCQFDADNYVNLCTMKAGCFVGDSDQYVASGSDDFNVYIWRIPDNDDTKIIEQQSSSHLSSDNFIWNAHMILRGHRSVVNQVRYSSRLHTIVSSGVEKIIKIWTPYQTRNNHNQNSKISNGRQRMYSAEDYLNAVYGSGSIHHDSSIESYDEDKRMLAFFDSLLQRELNGEDESDDDLDELCIFDTSDDETSTDNEEETTTLDDLEFDNSTISYSTDVSTQQERPTIESLAKHYRIQYVEKLKEINGMKSNSSTKRSLESPTMIESKRSCSILSNSNNNNNNNTSLQILRNRLRQEDNNEQLFFNDERRM